MTVSNGERLISGVRYITATAVQERVQVSRNTLYRWRKSGHIPQGARLRDRELVFTEQEFGLICAYAERLVPAVPESRGQEGAAR